MSPEEARAFAEALFDGARSHEKGGPIWSQHLDESA